MQGVFRLVKGVCDRCRSLPAWDELAMESEHPTCWARRVMHEWTAHQRAEVIGAMQIVLDSMRGAGDGTDAQKRRPYGRQNWNTGSRKEEDNG